MELSPARESLPISVVIPAYNQAAMLRRALRSVVAQRPALPAEVIVVDDASSDDTSAVARAEGATLIRHEHNRGIAEARNSGVREASQPWIALLDHDDEWLPYHLAGLWRWREDHVLVAGSAISDGSTRRAILHGPARNEPLSLTPAYLIFPGNPVPVSGALVRREVVEAVGGFRPPDGVDDLDLWIRVLEQGTGVVIPTVSVTYHEHYGQASLQAPPMQDRHIAVAERFAQRPWWSPELVEQWKGRVAWNNVRSSVRRRRPADLLRNAAWIAARPQRIEGAVRAAHQSRLRRRAALRRTAAAAYLDRSGKDDAVTQL